MITTKGTITGSVNNSQSIQGKVGIGTLYILPDNIVTIEIVEELPVPTEEYRGHFRIVETDSVDTLYICLKNVDTFEWVNLSNREIETHEHTYSEWCYNEETSLDERGCFECDYRETRTHEHNHQPGATITTKNPNDYCVKTSNPCTCGDVYYTEEKEHQWVEDWLDPNLEECTNCHIFRDKPTE